MLYYLSDDGCIYRPHDARDVAKPYRKSSRFYLVTCESEFVNKVLEQSAIYFKDGTVTHDGNSRG